MLNCVKNILPLHLKINNLCREKKQHSDPVKKYSPPLKFNGCPLTIIYLNIDNNRKPQVIHYNL